MSKMRIRRRHGFILLLTAAVWPSVSTRGDDRRVEIHVGPNIQVSTDRAGVPPQ
jgi:hypothetical protein